MLKIFNRKKGIKVAKLGDENSMYFNEKLKKWVERGKEAEAEADAPPAAPPTGATPVTQEVRGNGLASKYVDVGFGKPGEQAKPTTAGIFPGKSANPVPPTGMTFFVPEPPEAQEQEEGSTGEGDHNKEMENGDGEADGLQVPHNVKMRDPLEDFNSGAGMREEGGQKIPGDPLADVFGSGLGSKSSGDLSGADPLDDIFGGGHSEFPPEHGSPLGSPENFEQNDVPGVQPENGALDPEGGSEPQVHHDDGQQNFWGDAPIAPDSESNQAHVPAHGMDPDLVNRIPQAVEGFPEDPQSQDTKYQDSGVYGGVEENSMHADNTNGNQMDPAGVSYGWSPEQTAEFYAWMDKSYGDVYKTWGEEDWNNFWIWYNSPEAQAQMNPIESYDVTTEQEGEHGERLEAENAGNMGLPDSTMLENGTDPLPVNGVFHKHQSDPKMTMINSDADMPTAHQPAGDMLASVLEDNKLGGSFPWSDAEGGDSPVTTGVQSDSLSKSNGSFGSASVGFGISDSDFAQLTGFFAQLSAVLKSLTPGSDEIARQQAECQDQMEMLIKSMNKANGADSGNGVEIEHPKQIQESNHEDKIQELEYTYHQHITALQAEVESKNEVISRLELKSTSVPLGEGDGEVQKLKDELDNMLMLHRQQLTDVQSEMERTVAENEGLRDQLDRQAGSIRHMEDQLANSGHGDAANDSASVLREQYEEVICHLQKELDVSSSHLDDLGEKVSMFKTINEEARGQAEGMRISLETTQDENLTLQNELRAFRGESSKMQDTEAQQSAASKVPPVGKLMTALGIAGIQIEALSAKLAENGVDVKLLISEALEEYIEQ